MELILLTVAAVVRVSATVGLGVLLGFALGLWYARTSYYDGSENTGQRKWPAFQAWCADNWLVTLFRRHYVTHQHGYINNDGVCTGTVPADYYDRLLGKTSREGDNQPVIFAGHPHGLLAIASILTVGLPEGERRGTTRSKQVADMWRQVVPCVHRHVFAVPLLRDVALAIGAINVERGNMIHALESRSIYVAPGGCREMILATGQLLQQQQQQGRHTGFLQIAYTEKRLVYPMIHSGQDRVFTSYSCEWLNKLRHTVLDLTGYPFPTFFSGPWPHALTTYLCEPHNPEHYDSESDFINKYFERVERDAAAVASHEEKKNSK